MLAKFTPVPSISSSDRVNNLISVILLFPHIIGNFMFEGEILEAVLDVLYFSICFFILRYIFFDIK